MGSADQRGSRRPDVCGADVIGRAEIQRLAREGGVDERTQERDYVLTWLLAAAANRDFDLVFKGGTCLRRCYFEGYRYSEDLDFTRRPAASLLAIVDAAAAWCEWIAAEAGIRAEPIADETLGDRRAWVSFTGPLGASRQRAIKIDMANDEGNPRSVTVTAPVVGVFGSYDRQVLGELVLATRDLV